MLIKSVLTKSADDIVTCDKSTTFDQAMKKLIDNKISCLPVVDDKKHLIGIISDKDIFKKIHETKGEYHQLTVGEAMTSDLLVGVADDSIEYIAGLMNKNYVRHIPIVEGDKLVGMISQRDIIRVQFENQQVENRYLNIYLQDVGNLSGDN